jgi:hypothetical protein
MHDLLNKTGPYLHAPDDVSRISFETGGTPRVFTLLIAAATEARRADRSRSGIAILDEDEGVVVLDEHMRGRPKLFGAEFLRIRNMSWPEFSDFCRSHERFRGRSPDIVELHTAPLPGSRRRQARLSHVSPLSERVGDIRSDLMIRTDGDMNLSRVFPRISRGEAIEELCGTALSPGPGGLLLMNWALRFPDHSDFSGVQGTRPVDRSLDPAWSDLISRRPELIEEARLEAILPLLDGVFSRPGPDLTGRLGLILCPRGENGILLCAFDGDPIGVTDRKDLKPLLQDMGDLKLRDLWAGKRLLDHETASIQLGARFSESLNRIRSEMELARDSDPSPSGP